VAATTTIALAMKYLLSNYQFIVPDIYVLVVGRTEKANKQQLGLPVGANCLYFSACCCVATSANMEGKKFSTWAFLHFVFTIPRLPNEWKFNWRHCSIYAVL